MAIDPQAISALRHNQRQLDQDGNEVGVSRQALDELLTDHKKLSDALRRIANWELPVTNLFWDTSKTRPMNYESAYGSNGARDFIRGIARDVIE